MKGFTHFVTGLAAASCIPQAVRAGAAGNPLYFLLGGIAGLLPDTLDFKFARWAYRHDIEVVPDPLAPDPEMIADAMALAIHHARATGQTVNIKLHTVRLSATEWLRYRVTLDPANRQVVATILGPVTTDRRPVTASGAKPTTAVARLACAVELDYQADTEVDILDGPVFAMEPRPDGRVRAHFLPWHRQLSHSLPLAALCALAGACLWDGWAGLTIFAAYGAHLLADQTGLMGSALWYPLWRRRIPGWQLARSDSAWVNFGVCWTCGLVIFWNLSSLTPGMEPPVSLVQLLVFGGLLPLAALRALSRRLRSASPTAGVAQTAHF